MSISNSSMQSKQQTPKHQPRLLENSSEQFHFNDESLKNYGKRTGEYLGNVDVNTKFDKFPKWSDYMPIDSEMDQSFAYQQTSVQYLTKEIYTAKQEKAQMKVQRYQENPNKRKEEDIAKQEYQNDPSQVEHKKKRKTFVQIEPITQVKSISNPSSSSPFYVPNISQIKTKPQNNEIKHFDHFIINAFDKQKQKFTQRNLNLHNNRGSQIFTNEPIQQKYIERSESKFNQKSKNQKKQSIQLRVQSENQKINSNSEGRRITRNSQLIPNNLNNQKVQQITQKLEKEKDKKKEIERKMQANKQIQLKQDRVREQRERNIQIQRQKKIDGEREKQRFQERQKEKQKQRQKEKQRKRKKLQQQKQKQREIEIEKQKQKQKERERERERERDRDRDRDREREREKEREKEKERERERDREREKEREKQRETEREKQREKQQQRQQLLIHQRQNQKELLRKKQLKIIQQREKEQQKLVQLQNKKQKYKRVTINDKGSIKFPTDSLTQDFQYILPSSLRKNESSEKKQHENVIIENKDYQYFNPEPMDIIQPQNQIKLKQIKQNKSKKPTKSKINEQEKLLKETTNKNLKNNKQPKRSVRKNNPSKNKQSKKGSKQQKQNKNQHKQIKSVKSKGKIITNDPNQIFSVSLHNQKQIAKKIKKSNDNQIIAVHSQFKASQSNNDRPKRVRTGKLQFWKNQKPIYSKEGLILGISNLSSHKFLQMLGFRNSNKINTSQIYFSSTQISCKIMLKPLQKIQSAGFTQKQLKSELNRTQNFNHLLIQLHSHYKNVKAILVTCEFKEQILTEFGVEIHEGKFFQIQNSSNILCSISLILLNYKAQ